MQTGASWLGLCTSKKERLQRIPQSLYQQDQNHLADVIYEAATASNHFGCFQEKCLAQ